MQRRRETYTGGCTASTTRCSRPPECGRRRRFAGVRLHACYASDLNRAVQTALPVCKDHRLRLRREPAFREVCFGTWEDQSFGTLEHLYPEQMRVFRQNMWAWQAPGSETLEQATGRFIETLRAVA